MLNICWHGQVQAPNCFREHSNLIKIYVSPVAAFLICAKTIILPNDVALTEIIVILMFTSQFRTMTPKKKQHSTELKWIWPFRFWRHYHFGSDWICNLSVFHSENNQHVLFDRRKENNGIHPLCWRKMKWSFLFCDTGLYSVPKHFFNGYEIES